MPQRVRKPPVKRPFSLPPRWEDRLRRGVVYVGRVVERLIGEAGRVRSSMTKTGTSAQPVLSIEGQIPLPKLKEVISFAGDRIAGLNMPSLVDKTAIEIREGESHLAGKFKEKGASIVVHADIGGSAGSYGAEKGLASIRGLAWRLPFEDGFFDYAAGFFASQYQGDITKTMREFSRLLVVGGEGLIVDFHPFGTYARRGASRIRPAGSAIRGLEDYYKICKADFLKVTDVAEAFLDDSVRPLFAAEDEKASFRVVKGTPLLICLFVKKGG